MDITSQILARRSGGTVNLAGTQLPTFGYFVGGVVPALVVDGETVMPVSDIHAFVKSVDGQAEYLGWWTDEETGKLYVDATTWVADVDKAVRLGEERGEIAIFDIECKTSIYLDE